MKKTLQHPLHGYVIAILITAAAVGLRASLTPWVGERLALVTLFPAITAAIWFGGLRPALIPAVLGYAACVRWFAGAGTGESFVSHGGIIGLVAYIVAAGSILWFGGAMRRAQRQTREQQELLRVTLESIGEGVITTDVDGRVTSMNRKALALTGWSEVEASGRPIEDILSVVNERTRERLGNPLSNGDRGNDAAGLADQAILVARDGREIAIDENAAPIRDVEGRTIGGVLIIRDISRRRLMEQALRESGERHRFLAALAMSTQHLSGPEEVMATTARMLAEHLDADRCAYAEVEDESIYVITGDHTREVPSIVGRWPIADFGTGHERMMLANEAFVIDDVDADPRAGNELESYRQTRIQAVICVPLHKAGRLTAAMAVHQSTVRHWTEDDVELVRTVVGRCWESLERSRGGRELRETADRLVFALNAARLGDWSWHARGDKVILSERAAEIFGISPGPVMTWREMQGLLHPEDRERVLEAEDRAVEKREPYDVEYRVRRPENDEVWVSAKGLARYDANGAPIGLFGVLQDVTERKRLENNLRKNASELADADRKKDDFIAVLAHELRNPLAPIRSGLEVIRYGSADPDLVAQAREMMERQLNHMVRLVDDLLDVSRITRNKLLLQRKPILLAEVLGHALEFSKPVLEAGGHPLELALPEETVVIHGDLTRLTQVFGNLISNSAKFSDPGGPVEVAATVGEARVEISVTDRGIGICAEDLPRVFEMFVQVDRPGGRAKGGLGIGLGLVKALVELHGGSVTAESGGLGKGSRFSVSLPVDARRPDASGQSSGPLGTPALPALTNLKVLVADDNLDGAAALVRLLEILGSDAHTAHDGRAAVAAAERLRPDLILMDVGMPVLGGLEATRRIRALPWGNDPVIIALTGWGREEDRLKSKEAGCNGHLVKPVKIEDLEEMLGKLPKSGD